MKDVQFLNEVYGEYYNWQSSGELDVSFEVGKIISTSDFDAVVVYDLLQHYRQSGRHPCIDEAMANTDAKHVVVLAEVYASYICMSFDVRSYTTDTPEGQSVIVLGALGNTPTRPEILTEEGHAHQMILYSLTGMNFTRISGEPTRLDDGTRYVPAEHDFRKDTRVPLPPMLCLERETQGWPVGKNTPVCLRVPPDDYGVSIVAGERQVTIEWTVPAFTDGALISGYTVKLIEVPVVHHQGGGSSYGFGSDDTPVATYEASPNELSHTFDGLAPFRRYGAIVQAITKYGANVGELSDVGDHFHGQYMVDGTVVVTTPVQVTNLHPYGFTLTWDPVPGAEQYELMGFGSFKETSQIEEDGSVSSSRRVRPVQSNTVTLGPGDIEPDTTYTILVDVCDVSALGLSGVGCDRIATVTVTTPTVTTPAGGPQPEDPPRVTGISEGGTWIEFTWDRTPAAVAYMITHDMITDDESFWWFPDPGSGSAVTGRIEPLAPNTEYTFEIRSCVERDDGVYCGVPATVTATTRGE